MRELRDELALIYLRSELDHSQLTLDGIHDLGSDAYTFADAILQEREK